MITNRNLNTMIKPNNINGEFTMSGGSNMDIGVSVLQGKINHHFAMVIDIIYDHMYRLFNENREMNFIESSLRNLLTNGAVRKDYTTKLITDTKLEFYKHVLKIGAYYTRCKKEETSVPYDEPTRDLLLNGCPHLLENGFPPDFYIPFRSLLASVCEKEGTLDRPLKLLDKFGFEQRFFEYLLYNIFYTKYPIFNGYKLIINLNGIFENGERTIYVLKKWFEDSNDLKLSMTYPVTSFSDDKSKNLFWKSYMVPIPVVKPLTTGYNKQKMEIEISLKNKFMVYMANDARMCVGTYIPSSLYRLNSNAYFIGKGILNSTYYSKKLKGYTNKKRYSMGDMFEFVNLPEKDMNNRNDSYRRKAIFKALKQLDNTGIIKLDRMNEKEIILSDVWNISKTNCIEEED